VLIVDTGVLLAAADNADPDHDACAQLLEHATSPLVTTALPMLVVLADGSTKAVIKVVVGDREHSTDPATVQTVVRTVTALHRNDDPSDCTSSDAFLSRSRDGAGMTSVPMHRSPCRAPTSVRFGVVTETRV
jgi:hypothetical protein